MNTAICEAAAIRVGARDFHHASATAATAALVALLCGMRLGGIGSVVRGVFSHAAIHGASTERLDLYRALGTYVAATGSTLAIPDISRDARFGALAFATSRLGAYVGTPIFADTELPVGVIWAADDKCRYVNTTIRHAVEVLARGAAVRGLVPRPRRERGDIAFEAQADHVGVVAGTFRHATPATTNATTLQLLQRPVPYAGRVLNVVA